jgi:hypothetical protein
MKKIVFLFIGMFVMNVMAWAGNDKPINVSEMPKAAQQFIKRHFADQQVAVAKMETDFMAKSYDVIFTNGDKVEFDKKGNWTNVDCEHSQVPVDIIPAAIQKYVTEHYPQAKVIKIELTDRKGYDVELNNGFDIEFDKRFRVVEIDR